MSVVTMNVKEMKTKAAGSVKSEVYSRDEMMRIGISDL